MSAMVLLRHVAIAMIGGSIGALAAGFLLAALSAPPGAYYALGLVLIAAVLRRTYQLDQLGTSPPPRRSR
jgi:hypothetical protein